jgi:hypothetical protein
MLIKGTGHTAAMGQLYYEERYRERAVRRGVCCSPGPPALRREAPALKAQAHRAHGQLDAVAVADQFGHRLALPQREDPLQLVGRAVANQSLNLTRSLSAQRSALSVRPLPIGRPARSTSTALQPPASWAFFAAITVEDLYRRDESEGLASGRCCGSPRCRATEPAWCCAAGTRESGRWRPIRWNRGRRSAAARTKATTNPGSLLRQPRIDGPGACRDTRWRHDQPPETSR